ncbi:CAIB/BAIF protein [Pseudomonas coronafaciens pv. zizaniae]|nr:CAIB/BAIF protein [Pseudomonas coronafaciens pv. zizaniae]
MNLPLQGIKVVELGQLIAGPFAAKILAEFGAEVIKVEPPLTGDPLRKWRLLHNGTSVWWAVQSRNKQSVTLDLRQPKAQEMARRLIRDADVLIENFRPGTLESWGLSWEELHALNPKLIMLRVSGYGQTGPYRDRPGFGVIGEAMGGGCDIYRVRWGARRCVSVCRSVIRCLRCTALLASCWLCVTASKEVATVSRSTSRCTSRCSI